MSTAARSEGSFEVTHRLVLGLALPMTFGFLTVPLLGITDTAVAGRLGDPSALAGLAIGAVLFDLIFGDLQVSRSERKLVPDRGGKQHLGRALEYVTNCMGGLGNAHLPGVLAFQQYLSLGGFQQPERVLDQCRLPRTVVA